MSSKNSDRNKQVADAHDVSREADEHVITQEGKEFLKDMQNVVTEAQLKAGVYQEPRIDDNDNVKPFVDDTDEQDSDLRELLVDESEVEVDLYLIPRHEFPTGVEVELRAVAPMAVEYLQSNEVGKPKAPRLYNGKHRPPVPEKTRETESGELEAYYDYADPVWIQAYEAWIKAHKHRVKMKLETVDDHPDFMLELRRWQANKQRKLVRYLAIKGVADMPPQEYIDEALIFMHEDSSLNDLKYMWIMEQLPDEDAIEAFYEAVAGVTMPTQSGVEEVKKS